MSVKERLILFIKSKKMSVRKFELTCGLSLGYVNNIRVSIQPDKVTKIASCFPDLNTGWLLAGVGEMLKNKEPELKPYSINLGEGDKTMNYLMEENIEFRRTIGHQAESILKMQEQITELYRRLDKKS